MENPLFAQKLIDWYQKNQRDLPWRHTKDPYKIWLSEIILQQTRVAQGLPYYLQLVARYPKVGDLAKAPEEELLRLWQGLGYYSRARNLHNCAKIIVAEHQGKFPADYKKLLKLKGVGPYTAAAIASFAFKISVPVFDGNVYRVLSRIFGLDDDIATQSGRQAFIALGEALISRDYPDIYNQAIMEFGAVHCTPKQPKCSDCIYSMHCYAFLNNQQNQLPVKTNKVKVTDRYFHYFVLIHNRGLWMNARNGKDIWQGLYDFHLLEATEGLETDKLLDQVIGSGWPTGLVLDHESPLYRHKLTHQQIHARFFHLVLDHIPDGKTFPERLGLTWHTLDEVRQLPKPILIDKYLKEALF